MACLRAAVIAYNNTRLEIAGQEISQQAFAGISKTKIDKDVCAQR
jgi:hypothetical protein